MPLFLDVHPLAGKTEKDIKNIPLAPNAPRDKFGVLHLTFFYNIDEDRWFCLHDAPNKEAIENHHEAADIKCDWIVEVKDTKMS
jgi:hypothetical protein